MELRAKSSARKKPLIILGITLALCALGAVAFVAFTSKNTGDDVRAALQKELSATNFAIYYPKMVPGGYSLHKNSVGYFENQVVMFTLDGEKGKKIVISQQARPKLMEEVVKTKEFTSPVGKAYIANLGNHTAGFLVAQNTLVIVTPSGDVDQTDIERLLQNLTKL